MADARVRASAPGSRRACRVPARSTGTTTTSADTRRPSAGPSGVCTVTGDAGRSRVASAASSRLIRTAIRRNSSGGVRASRSVTSASCTSGCSTTWTDTYATSYIAMPIGGIESALHAWPDRSVRVPPSPSRRLAAAQAPQRRTVSLVVTNGTVVTVDANRRVIERGAVAIDGPRHRRGRYRGGDRREISRPGHDRRRRRRGHAGTDQHPHARADGPVPRAGGRPGADGLAAEVHLPGGSENGDAGVRPRRHAARGARDDRVRDDHLRRHVLLRGGDRRARRRLPACAASSARRSSSSRCPTPRRPPKAWRASERFAKEFAGDELITPAVAPHAMYTLDADTLKACRALADRLRIPVIIHLAETKDEIKTAEREVSRDADGVPRVARLLGPAHAGGARRPPDPGRHRDPRQARRRRRPQPREQHEARQRHRAGRGDAQGGRRGRPRHRRRRQQQRPRHVRGDAPGRLPAQAEGRRSARGSGSRGARDGARSTARARSGWRRRSARSKPASAPTC